MNRINQQGFESIESFWSLKQEVRQDADITIHSCEEIANSIAAGLAYL